MVSALLRSLNSAFQFHCLLIRIKALGGWAALHLSSILACELRAFSTMPSAAQLLLMTFSSEKGVYFSYISSEFYLLSKLSVFIFYHKD